MASERNPRGDSPAQLEALTTVPVEQLKEKYFSLSKRFGRPQSHAPTAEMLSSLDEAIRAHADDEFTVLVVGTFKQNQPAHMYVNMETKFMVMTHPDGTFWSAWQLDEVRYRNVMGRGSL